jgi:inorganic pyrophosphatase/exopolyphosphatase
VTVQGSCTSLLGEMIIKNAPVLLSEANFEREIDYANARVPTPLGVVQLLWHVLLLDTSNMSPVTHKYKERDLFVYEKYKQLLQDLTYAELIRRRSDITQLTIQELLAKDTKYGENTKYPHFVASIPGSLVDMAKKDVQMLPRIEEYARQRGLRFVVVLTTHMQGVYRRQVTILVNRDSPSGPPAGTLSDEALFAELKKTLEAASQDLDLQPDDNLLPPEHRAVPHQMLVQTYEQRNLKGSRKQVAPLLEGLLSKL